MRVLIGLALVVGCCDLLLGAPAPQRKGPNAKEVKASRERVRKLFENMRAGGCQEVNFPALTWQDVPALLEVAPSEVVLQTFPKNLISSYYQRQCPEGMVALWLIEGVRQGGKYPSPNPLCLRRGHVEENLERQSADNHRQALAAYRAWWLRAKALPARGAALVPLDKTGLAWR